MQPQEKALKQIKNAGLTIEGLGYFSGIIGLIALVALTIIQLNLPSLTIALVVSIIISIVYIVLGHKIRKETPSASTKSKLIIVLVISAAIVIGNFAMMSKSTSSEIIPVATLVSAIIGLNALKKLQVKPEAPTITQ
ncbi:MAG: hypothetical protein V4524_03815 [Patescibacteria group bacterium]